MLINMRTTIVLEDRLAREAKRRAANRGVTLSEVINDALRVALAPQQASAPQFQMITFGTPGPSVHREPADMSAALEEEEQEALRG